MSILSLQKWNLFVLAPCFTFSKIMKRWSRWSSKSRSPTMRHVSRTHSVALDWLFDRIGLQPNIQIKYVDTKNQLADILTEGNLTRDEWNHFLHLFNISNSSSASCPQTVSKRIEEGTREEIIVAKSRPTLNLVSKGVANSSTVQSSSASNCLSILKPLSQSLSLIACEKRPAAEDSNQNDAASSCQMWQSELKSNAKCGETCGWKVQV